MYYRSSEVVCHNVFMMHRTSAVWFNHVRVRVNDLCHKVNGLLEVVSGAVTLQGVVDIIS